MKLIRQKVVFEQKGDTRKASDIAKAQNMTDRRHDKILVQRYICNELDYQGRKFDLRVYFLIASVDVSKVERVIAWERAAAFCFVISCLF